MIQAPQVRADGLADERQLARAINSALAALASQTALAIDGAVKMRLLEPVDILVVGNTPGSAPWPLRLSQVASAPLGVLLLRLENLTTSGPTGVPTSAVSITSQRVEAQTIFVDFVSGLTAGSRYRLRFGVIDAI